MKLGPFEIKHPFILAPMAGITHSPFRQIMRARGSALVVSELISANGLHYGGKRTEDLLRFDPSERPVGIQIFGEHQDQLVEATQKVEALGADFVDLNLGCPVPKIVKKGAGAALCRDLKNLAAILKAMVQSVKIPITIKVRTGWDAASINVHEIVQMAADVGITWVAVHGRTRAQGYSGKADWELIAEVKRRSPIPILGNGDILTPEQAIEYYEDSQVDAVLIGRGALRNPFIFEQIEALLEKRKYTPPRSEDYLHLIRQQKEIFEAFFEPQKALLHSRKFLAWYAAGFPHCHEFRQKVFTIQEPEVLWKETEGFFRVATEQRENSFLSQPFLMGGHG